MRNRLFPYGTQSQAVTTSVQFQEPDTNAVLSGTDDLDMEEGRMEEVIVTAFHQDIASRVFASRLSRDYGLCIILANPTEVEELSLFDLPAELPVVLAPSSVCLGPDLSVGKMITASVAAFKMDPRCGLGPVVYARLWTWSVLYRCGTSPWALLWCLPAHGPP